MKKLVVHYCGWGEDWPLGTLADDDHNLLFEYSPAALAEGLELSPLQLRLASGAYGEFPRFQLRLPGLIADSLPDGWGMLLMDRLFRRQGLRHPGPLERLAYIGDRGMGALRFAPADESQTQAVDWNLLTLAQESKRLQAGEPRVALRELALTGGAPQGARPKALVQYDAANNTVSTLQTAPGAPWLIKFPAAREHWEVCVVEQLYADLARDCGLDMPASAWFDLSPELAAFGVARFDRHCGQRVPIHSLAGLLQADYRIPGSMDYTTFLRATQMLTRDAREVEKAFSRAVFNVLFHNRDDHPKNFAWRLGRDRRWRLAPAFDLTFSAGPMGEHYMDVCGNGDAIDRSHLLKLAAEGGVPKKTASRSIDTMLAQAQSFGQRASAYPLRKATIERLKRAVARCGQRLL